MILTDGSNTNVYSLLIQQLDETFSSPDTIFDENDGLEGRAYRNAVLKGYLNEHNKELICTFIFIACVLHIFVWIGLYIFGILRIDTSFSTGNIIYVLVTALIPFVNWINSTRFKSYSIYNKKIGWLRFCMGTLAFMMTVFIFHHAGNVIIPVIVALMKPTASRSIQMVKMFCRCLLFISSIVPGMVIFRILNRSTKNELTRFQILNFDISEQFDFRGYENKEFAYDMVIVKHLDDGKDQVIKEKDRFLHALDVGSTGSGKTSSTFTPAIENDFEQRVYNLEHQKMGVEKLLALGEVQMKTPMSDLNFDIDNFEPLTPNAEKTLYKLKYKSPLASIIAVAPNEGFADEIYSLAKAKGVSAHRLDPMISESGRLKEGYVGLNPFYIKPGRSELQYMIEVFQRATLFADVVQSIYDKSGQSNPYFAGLNQNITTSVTVMVLLCAPYMDKFKEKGLVPTAADVQDIINDFQKAKVYCETFRKVYAKPGTQGSVEPQFGNLQQIWDVVNGEMLGPTGSSLFDKCNGLRNIINQFLNNTMIRNILCTQSTIDFDQVLAKGEVVIVNYALNLGKDGVTFGLFVLLSLINAAFRRPNPESERLPSFVYVDELPQLLHPRLESCFSLFRQYRIAMFVAIQTLSQLDKEQSTKFLKQVLLGNCAHHFVFGRAGVEDMEIYSALAGTSLKEVLTESLNESSILSDNPSVSYQHRKVLQQVANIEGSDIRHRKFQQCTMITVADGTPVSAFAGIVFFLPKYRREKRKRYQVDWNEYYMANGTDGDISDNRMKDVESAAHIQFKERLSRDSFQVMQPGYDYNRSEPETDTSGNKDTSGNILMFSSGVSSSFFNPDARDSSSYGNKIPSGTDIFIPEGTLPVGSEMHADSTQPSISNPIEMTTDAAAGQSDVGQIGELSSETVSTDDDDLFE